MRKALVANVVATLAGVVAGVPPLQAETVNCTPIDSVPYVILASGAYCLTGDLVAPPSADQPAISIKTHNVTLDLNGYTLDGGAWAAQTGIRASGYHGITIRNGRISWFLVGVFLGGETTSDDRSGGFLVENLEVRHSLGVGILCFARRSVVRNNRVADTGGGDWSVGIYAGHSEVRILDNDVMNGRGMGIAVLAAGGAIVEGNRVTATSSSGSGQSAIVHGILISGCTGAQINGNRVANRERIPNSYGIRIADSTDVAVRDNVVSFMVWGVAYTGASSGKYMGNLTSGVNVPYSYGTAAGETNY